MYAESHDLEMPDLNCFTSLVGSAEGGVGFPNVVYEPGFSVEGCVYELSLDSLSLLDTCIGFPKVISHFSCARRADGILPKTPYASVRKSVSSLLCHTFVLKFQLNFNQTSVEHVNYLYCSITQD